MFSLALLLQLAVTQPANMSWRRSDTALLLSSSAMIAADCLTTRANLARGGRETNPFLDQHPSAGSLNTYCGVALGLNAFMGWVLPPNLRRTWFTTVTVTETYMTGWNLHVGARLPT